MRFAVRPRVRAAKGRRQAGGREVGGGWAAERSEVGGGATERSEVGRRPRGRSEVGGRVEIGGGCGWVSGWSAERSEVDGRPRGWRRVHSREAGGERVGRPRGRRRVGRWAAEISEVGSNYMFSTVVLMKNTNTLNTIGTIVIMSLSTIGMAYS